MLGINAMSAGGIATPRAELLIRPTGADGSTSFVDEGWGKRTITTYGDAQVDIAQSKFGGTALLLDGVGGIPAVDRLEFSRVLSTGKAFSIFAWIRPTGNLYTDATWGRYIYTQYEASPLDSNRFVFGFPESSSAGVNKLQAFNPTLGVMTGTTVVTTNAWHFVELSHDGSSGWWMFLDGFLEASKTQAGVTLANQVGRLGSASSGANKVGGFLGHIGQFGIITGEAWHKAAYTVPDWSYPSL